MIETPILFLVFNRPETTSKVFEAIRAARPQRLYVAADGPRATRPAEQEACRVTRAIATAIDWPCDLHTHFRDVNLGCRQAVSSAIDWFFECEPQGIILEDDCLPDASFFPYCASLLQQHRDDPRIMCVSGDNFVSDVWSAPESYYYSKFSHIWGWATWRRAWQHYRVHLPEFDAARTAALRRVFPDDPRSRRFWEDCFRRVARGEIDTWDYQWNCACWLAGGLTCLPAQNLISNIGFGAGATHTHDASSNLAGKPTGRIEQPLRAPAQVANAEFADAWSAEHLYPLRDYRLKKVLSRRLRQMFGANR